MTISQHAVAPWRLILGRRVGSALLASLLLALTGCEQPPPPPTKPAADRMVPLQLSILNYTDEYIDEVFVERSWAGNMVAHSGGGKFAGFAEVPRQWDPNYKLTVRWQTESLYLKDPDAYFEREVATEPYQQETPGGITFLWIAFFPEGVVKLYPTLVGPLHPDFPDGLTAPSWACEKQFPGNPKCFRRTPSWEKQPEQDKEVETP
ncbi:DUF3304 domain-containing protein [Zestomonas carbonaria]|uniref:DUF3304 domain-containing protein n=1 Tax=Zestomonas carbonaria TaxID=2762745 RepID=A0A7U7IBG4_9GAMM|nr:DUF3304 domain-containing protein [Pseudomonas carbonaria]CAD5110455.1 hypothetical protein PSEWESI4_04778 [Pseudomonas carbonaria]